MVGVPRSKGCNACREQKKRCIVNTTTPCVRCDRLRIECRGYGERRLKFQAEHPDRSSRSSTTPWSSDSNLGPRGSTATVVSRNRAHEHGAQNATLVLRRTINSTDSLASTFVHYLSRMESDPRYQLSLTFGDFLDLIPQHLGTNKSLDTAVEAILSTYNDYRVHGYACRTTQSLQRYSQALNALRTTLSSANTACQSTTMSAIMIHMIIELFLSIPSLQHSGGAAQILKCRGIRPPEDELEKRILITIRGPVTIQAMFLDEDYFTEEEWEGIVTGYCLDRSQGPMSYFYTLSDLIRLFQKARKALLQNPRDMAQLRLLEIELRGIQQKLELSVARLGAKETTFRLANASLDSSKKEFSKEHFTCVRDYGMTIMTSIVANYVMDGLCTALQIPYESDSTLLCTELIGLAPEVTWSRPLGCCWYPMPLGVAYTATADEQQRHQILDLMGDFAVHAVKGNDQLVTKGLDEFGDFMRLRNLKTPKTDTVDCEPGSGN